MAILLVMSLSHVGCGVSQLQKKTQEMLEKNNCNSKKKMQEDTKLALLEKLNKAPTWTNILKEQKELKKDLLTVLFEIAGYDTENIRNFLLEYIRNVSDVPGGMNIDKMSNVFVLNRLLFNVPSKVPANKAMFFGGWAGVPHDENFVDMLWPLSFLDQHLDLVGEFCGYYGDVYDAIGEFDYFLREYGRRI